jgi:hypothetical protein
MRSPRCPACIAQAVMWFGGIARDRGGQWAKRVAAQVGTERDWPPYEGKAADIARRLVSTIDRDEGVREELARLCHAHAAWWWERLRASGPASA